MVESRVRCVSRERLVGLVAALVLLGCGGSEVVTPGGGSGGEGGGEEACPAPGRLVGDECRAPGQQDDGCSAGRLLVDGTCAPAGMPPTGCPEGFEVAGLRCVAILTNPCPEGLMAPPGETECRPPMPCGDGTWGDIPVEDDTVYVDGSYSGGSSDGSAAHPYVTIGAGLANAPDGAIVAVAGGTYGGTVFMSRPVRLWGICPRLVTIDHPAAFAVVIDADQIELRGVTVRRGGVAVGEATEVLIEGVHVLDTLGMGVAIGAATSATEPGEATLRSTLIERATGCGLIDYSSRMTVEDCEIRDTQIDAMGRGYGIGVQRGLLDARASASVRTTRVEGSREAGLYTLRADLHLESVAVLDTEPDGNTETLGYGIAIQGGAEPSVATIDGIHIRGAYTAGLFSIGSEVDVGAATIEEVLPQASTGMSGGGLMVRQAESSSGSLVDARWCFIDQTHEAGVAVSSSELSITGCIIRNTHARPDGDFGHGVSVSGPSSILTLEGSVIDTNTSMGLQLSDGAAVLTGTILRGTAASEGGLFGDGAVAVAVDGQPTLQVEACLLASNARAGLSAFGAAAIVQSTLFECNPIALVTEAFGGLAASIQDGGGNSCRCGDEQLHCEAQSAQLDPPLPLPAPPEDVPGLP